MHNLLPLEFTDTPGQCLGLEICGYNVVRRYTRVMSECNKLQIVYTLISQANFPQASIGTKSMRHQFF